MITVRGVVLEHHTSTTNGEKQYRIRIWDMEWRDDRDKEYWIYGKGNKPSFVRKGVEIIAEITDKRHNIKSIKKVSKKTLQKEDKKPKLPPITLIEWAEKADRIQPEDFTRTYYNKKEVEKNDESNM